MRSSKALLLCSTLVAGAALASAAMAQPDAPPPAPEPKPLPTTSAPATAEAELVVTGSHIARTEFTSASPIQVITAETTELKGLVDTGQIVQESSIASGSFQANNLLSGF